MYQSALQANPQQGIPHSQTSLFIVAFYSDTSLLTSENTGKVETLLSHAQLLREVQCVYVCVGEGGRGGVSG